jgi:PPOX class probable F420-dependent enzyme
VVGGVVVGTVGGAFVCVVVGAFVCVVVGVVVEGSAEACAAVGRGRDVSPARRATGTEQPASTTATHASARQRVMYLAMGESNCRCLLPRCHHAAMTDHPLGMGRGVNQRRQIRMSDEEVAAFLAERRAMSMCTLNHDGTIHAVAMWYGFLDGSVAIETKAKSQKALNLRRDPRMTCLFEAGDTYEDLRGVELVGTAEIVEDPERIFELGKSVFSRYYAPYTEEMRGFVETMLAKRIVAKLHVDRTVTWDHRKLGLPPTPRPTASA